MIVYIDSASFSNATSVYLDELLTIIAPDGYYSDGSYYRQQIDGNLIDLLPCVGIDTVSITNVTETTATFNGNLINNGGDVNAVRGFVYGTSTNPTTANSVITDSIRAQGTYSLNANGLTSGVTYYVRAYTIVFGETIYGDELSFINSCSTCSVPDVTIGTQIWTGCNLDVTTYADISQTPIPQVTDPTEWAGLTTGAWCYMNNDPAFGCIYGKLYNWYAVTDPRGLAPAGYHVPSDSEWGTLISNLGGVSVAGGKMKATGTIQAGTGLWDDPNAAATNESGFTGLPGDGRSYNGAFNFTSTYGYFWSNTTADVPDPEPKAWSYYLRDYDGAATRSTYNKTGGFSIRLIKD